MPVIDKVSVELTAEWTGSSAISRMESDLKRVEAASGSIGKTFESTFGRDWFANAGNNPNASRALVQLQALEARSQSIKKEMAGLGAAVNSGSMSLSGATSRMNQYMGEIGRLEPQLAKIRNELGLGDDAAKRHSLTITELISKYRAFVFGATAVAVGVKGIVALFSSLRDVAEEGAGINQLTQSFRNLTTSMLDAPNLLRDMSAAARGTVSDLSLMKSFMTLVAGTSESFGKALAANAPRLLEIAKAANALNPTLGDTSFFFDSLARGIKRSEIRIIDNLGIIVKVGDANKKYAEQIGKTVSALTAEERQIALLNETLRVGGQLIEQVGGSTASLVDPYLQAAAAGENLGNSVKSVVGELANFAAVGAADELQYIAESFVAIAERAMAARLEVGAFIDAVTPGQLTPAQKIGNLLDLRAEYPRVRRMKQRRMIEEEINDIVLSITEGSSNLEEANMRLQNAFGADSVQLDPNRGFANLRIQGKTLVIEMKDINRQIEQVARDRRVALQTFDYSGDRRGANFIRQSRERADSIRKYGGVETSMWQLYMTELEKEIKRQEGVARWWEQDGHRLNDAVRSVLEERAQIAREFAAAQEATRVSAFADIFDDNESDLIIGSTKNLGKAIVVTTNATDDQRRALEVWKEEYKDAADAVWDLEHGVGTFGDEQDDLAKKLEKARGEMEHYRQLIEGVESQLETTTSNVTRYIDFDENKVFRGIIDSMQEAGANSDQLIRVAEALGLMTPAAAEAARALGAVETAVDFIGQRLAKGIIDPGTAQAAINELISSLESGLSVADLKAEIRLEINQVQARNARNDLLPEGDRQQTVDIYSDIDPARTELGQFFRIIPTKNAAQEAKVKIFADVEPAKTERDAFVEETKGIVVPIAVQVKVDDSDWQDWYNSHSGGGGGGGGGGSDEVVAHSGGYIGGHRLGAKGSEVPAMLQTGEYVLRRSAVDKLGTGFLDRLNRTGGPLYGGASNTITIQFNNYGQSGATRPISPILLKTSDPMEQIARALRENGVNI